MDNSHETQKYSEHKFIGERAMFKTDGADFEYCTFLDGESPLKESKNIVIKGSTFEWKYPLWYCRNVRVESSMLLINARAGIWYTNDLVMKNMTIEAPKTYRKCSNMTLENISMPNAAETLWNCSNITASAINAKGDYFGMGCQNAEFTDFSLVGNYPFDGARNISIKNANLISKDAFWNCENITVYNSFISGEYLAWNSKNITFINCQIESLQGLCYIDNLVLKNCRLVNTNLAFEYSTVKADIKSKIDSIKNPYSGFIAASGIDDIIFDDPNVDRNKTVITIQTEN